MRVPAPATANSTHSRASLQVAEESLRIATDKSILAFVNDTSYWVCPEEGLRIQQAFWRRVAPSPALHRELLHFKDTVMGGEPYAGGCKM